MNYLAARDQTLVRSINPQWCVTSSLFASHDLFWYMCTLMFLCPVPCTCVQDVFLFPVPVVYVCAGVFMCALVAL